MHLVSMHITKAALGKDGIMRWAATVSKFEPDVQNDEVTPAFYKSAIAAIESGKRPSPVLCISHIDKGKPSDDWVAGDVAALYIDGNAPKAKGTFRDTPLGKAAFEAVRADYGKPDNEKARISMGFYSEQSEPVQKTGRRFLKGWIKHLALTRVPVVAETMIELEEKSMSITKKEDAVTIVGEELAEKLLPTDEEKAQFDEELVVKADEEGVKVTGKMTVGSVDAEPEEKTDLEEKQATDGTREQVTNLLQQIAQVLGTDIDALVANAVGQGSSGTAPANAAPAEVKSEAEKAMATSEPETPHSVQVAAFVDSFAMQVKATLLSDGDRKEKFTHLQQHLNQFGEGVQSLVKESTPASPRDTAEIIADAVRQATEPLANELASVKAELTELQKARVVGESPTPVPQALDAKARVINPNQTLRPPAGKKAWSVDDLAYASTARY